MDRFIVYYKSNPKIIVFFSLAMAFLLFTLPFLIYWEALWWLFLTVPLFILFFLLWLRSFLTERRKKKRRQNIFMTLDEYGITLAKPGLGRGHFPWQSIRRIEYARPAGFGPTYCPPRLVLEMKEAWYSFGGGKKKEQISLATVKGSLKDLLLIVSRYHQTYSGEEHYLPPDAADLTENPSAQEVRSDR